MLTMELAGHTLTYRNAPDLNAKARGLLTELHEKAQSIEKHAKALRQQERIILRFLGEGKINKPVQTLGRLALTNQIQEENHNA